MLRVTWCYIHLHLRVSSFICPILSTSHGRLIDRGGHMRRPHAGNMCDPHTVIKKYYNTPEILYVWPPYSSIIRQKYYKNMFDPHTVLEKYYNTPEIPQKNVWPPCNYLEGFNYEEPSSGVDPLSHGGHFNQRGLFNFSGNLKTIQSKICWLK